MFNEESKKFFVTIDDEEKEMEVLFTFEPAMDYPGYEGRKYVVYFDPNASEDNQVLFCCRYDDEGHLFPIETQEEWDMVEEVLNAFNEDEEDEE